MIKNGKGGGNTRTGINFEDEVDFLTIIVKQKGYRVEENNIFYKEEKVAQAFKKFGFYKYLKEQGVNWEEIVSAKLLPDDAIYVIANNTFLF